MSARARSTMPANAAGVSSCLLMGLPEEYAATRRVRRHAVVQHVMAAHPCILHDPVEGLAEIRGERMAMEQVLCHHLEAMGWAP